MNAWENGGSTNCATCATKRVVSMARARHHTVHADLRSEVTQHRLVQLPGDHKSPYGIKTLNGSSTAEQHLLQWTISAPKQCTQRCSQY
jgi:hypothetical protein|eukprot:COSAG01_NODE_1226_length_11140_cov_73.834798_15_plen_89_part_00